MTRLQKVFFAVADVRSQWSVKTMSYGDC